MSESRTILHADMDAFFASVEQRDDPGLQGQPVVVGGAPPRGVVAAASYEARVFGIHSAMPMARALRLCPELVMLEPNGEVYAQVSARVMQILGGFSPLVEPLSLDEAFLDISGTERLHGPPLLVAQTIKARVREELDLVVSVGVAPNKHVAKIASDLGKPDGLVVVQPGEVMDFLRPLSVSRIFGVGPVTRRKLEALGITTIGQLADLPQQKLRHLGLAGEQIWRLARGQDSRPVEVDREAESISHENTFAHDLDDLEELEQVVQDQADRVAARLRRHGLAARVVVLKAKAADFTLRTRRKTLPRRTADGTMIGSVARQLLARLVRGGIGPLRLTGVAAADMAPELAPGQLTFDEPEHQQQRSLGQTLDRINEKFGKGSLVRGTRLSRTERGARKAERSAGDAGRSSEEIEDS